MAGAFFSRDELKGFRRWELPDVGEPKASEPTPEPQVPLPTVADLEGLEREAREAGYAAGLAEGRAAAREALREQVDLLEGILRAAARPLDALDDATEQELARLALVIARQVIGHELRTSPELVVSTVRQAVLALPSAARTVRVYLHPEDLALLRELDAAESDWQLIADLALQRGDCRVESETSRLDARVETRLAAVADAVFGDEAGSDDPELEMA
ncbi:flagellar assembly protein FliH [Dyella sp. BiH032]|uniref:flagellar assembly protein FliH n=1 Tax=Dyella sp. BiH032 TaxID=3075430 RepID=UPI002892E7BB|nr:flagellar assembly protein FliH [Dyella sp. BiH032]WNL47260.1 flagellar assembly protein FliH [Dyella sp. BiH032]